MLVSITSLISTLSLLYGAESRDESISVFIKSKTNIRLPSHHGVRVRIAYGKNITLFCKGPRSVTWSAGDEVLPSVAIGAENGENLYQQFHPITSEQYLYIRLFRKSYRGLYTCATNSGEKVAKHIIIENTLPIDKEVILPNRTYETAIDSKTSVTGYIYGFNVKSAKQSLKVTWLKDSVPLDSTSDPNIEISSTFHFMYTLTWKQVRASDFGTYTLQAKSEAFMAQDNFVLLSTTRIEIEDSLDKLVISESSGKVAFCIIMTRPKPGDTVVIIVEALNTGSAIPKRDYEPYRMEHILDFNAPRKCIHIKILQNGLITGPIPLRFSVGVYLVSSSRKVSVSSDVLSVSIVDSDVLDVGFVSDHHEVFKGGKIFQVCAWARREQIFEGVNVIISPQLPQGSIPTQLLPFGNKFQFNSTSGRSCIRLQATQDHYIDNNQTTSLSMIQPDSIKLNLVNESSKILIRQTNGAEISILKKLNYIVPEGPIRTAKRLNLCFGLVDVGKGLRRKAVVKARTIPITAEEGIDYRPIDVVRTFSSNTPAGRHFCERLLIYGDNLREENEMLKFVIEPVPPDYADVNKFVVIITIRDDGDVNDCREKIHKFDHGKVYISGTNYRSLAVYKCNYGYDTYPPGVRHQVCGGKGWMGVKPECRKVCYQFNVTNGRVQYSQDYAPLYVGALARIKCNPTYYEVGPGLIMCTKYGWTGAQTLCREIQCPRPRSLKHGDFEVTNYRPHAMVIYRCRLGYTLSLDGFANSICLEDGTWDGVLPKCLKDKECNQSSNFILLIVELCFIIQLYQYYYQIA